MKTVSILLVLAVVAGTGRGAEEGGCGRAGALRCDADGRHLSACTKGGAWWPVRDCGASHAACVDGRCVPQLSSGATRADECTPNTWGCKDCDTRQYCTANGNWIDVGPCGEEKYCICGECKPKANNTCEDRIICSSNTANIIFPNLSDCKKKMNCEKEGEPPSPDSCETGHNFDPCEGTCDTDFCWPNEPCGSSDLGYFKVVLGNPSLYYLCAGDLTILYKCPGDKTFYPTLETCLAPVLTCDNDGTTEPPVTTSVMKHLSYDDCSSNEESPSGCTPGEKLAYPGNDCLYYFCVTSDNTRVMTCNENTKFDATVKNCVVSSGSCLKV